MSDGASQAKQANTRDRLIGLGLVGASFVAALVISTRSKEASMPLLAEPPAPPTADGIEGFPAAVKPLSLEARARALTARDQLVGIALREVKPDGTLDATGGGARFVFRSLAGEGPEPPRPYGTLPDKKYCGFQVVKLSAAGLGAQKDVADADCRRAIEPLPAPACSLEQLWQLAKQRGASEQPADVDYYRATAGPAWFFQAGQTTFSVAADCSTVLTDDAAQGVSPRRVPE